MKKLTKKSRYCHRTNWRNQNVRLPQSYPWKVLQTLLVELDNVIDPEFASALSRIVRERDVEAYLDLSTTWGLQSIAARVRSTDGLVPSAELMLSSLFKKFAFPGDSSLRKQAAISAFLAAERSCSRSNTKGRRVYKDKTDAVLSSAKHFVKLVLGEDLPAYEVLTETSRHGPGASSNTSRGHTTAYDKYACYPYEVTPRCEKHVRHLILSDERWLRALLDAVPFETADSWWSKVLTLVDSNRVTTVPKDARTERPIAVEPVGNMMLQLGVDGFIRRRLKRWGINLDDQSKNQRLAYEGSVRIDGLAPATIDLASASDTVSLAIVRELLPAGWYRYMVDIRSPKGRLPDGTLVRYSKLSSMGNGATFAIESLIFAALLYGCCWSTLGYFPRDEVSVFGDDIICPEVVAPLLVQYLGIAGFTVNSKKSFLEGPVKESCGSDYYQGHCIRPVHIKTAPTTVGELFCDRNRIHRWLVRHYDRHIPGTGLDELYTKWLPEMFEAVVGPECDEEFDTYWHVPASFLKWDINQSCKLKVLHARYAPRSDGERFFFRSLMARLGVSHTHKWADPLLSASSNGNAFELYDRNRIRRGLQTRRFWRDASSYSAGPYT